MKKIKILILIIFCGSILYILHYIKISQENLEDIKRVKLGMQFKQVKKIMTNEPLGQEIYDFEPDEFISLYQSPISSSGDLKIIYSKNDSIVKRIYKGD